MKAILPLLLVLYGAQAQAAAPITVYYEERAPLQVRSGDTLGGLVGGPAALAFQGAKIDVAWESASMGRALHILRENQGMACVVALFKTKERMAYAKYSKPIYRDGPKVLLARRSVNIPSGSTLSEALSSPEVRLVVRSGYSYGKHIDDLLPHVRAVTIASPKSNRQLSELLVADRADMLIASEEESAILLAQLDSKASQLQVLHFPDLLPGEERHISCTRNVSDEVIERLDGVIGSWGQPAQAKR